MNKHGDLLPDETKLLDPEQVQALFSMLKKKDEQLKDQEENINHKEQRIQTLQHQLDWFKRQLFGQKSEKKDFSDHPYQITIAALFGSPEQIDSPSDEKQAITYE